MGVPPFLKAAEILDIDVKENTRVKSPDLKDATNLGIKALRLLDHYQKGGRLPLKSTLLNLHLPVLPNCFPGCHGCPGCRGYPGNPDNGRKPRIKNPPCRGGGAILILKKAFMCLKQALRSARGRI